MKAPSTKPLFRAMKSRAKGQADSLPLDLPQSAPAAPRRALDFYPTTQPEPIRALLSRDGARIRQLGEVWEPAAGRGDIAREIIAAGLPCLTSDIHDHGLPGVFISSFYDWRDAPAPAIITNPPYSEINARDGHGRWLRHSLAMTGWHYMALLLSWDWPAARQNGLGTMLDRQPFTRCYLMRWKIDFTGAGSPPQRNAWFVWDRDDPRATDGTLPHPDFCFLDRDDARQGALL
jgi:hypothetical protein